MSIKKTLVIMGVVLPPIFWEICLYAYTHHWVVSEFVTLNAGIAGFIGVAVFVYSSSALLMYWDEL